MQSGELQEVIADLVVGLIIYHLVNLLAFYHECCSLIGYAAHYLFGDR